MGKRSRAARKQAALTKASVQAGQQAAVQMGNGSPFVAPPGLVPNQQGIVTNLPAQNDPAFQPPSQPLKDRKALVNRARIITRDVPNVVIQIGWTVNQVRAALQDLVVGLFDTPAQLLDAIAGDSRVQSAMRSRSGGLLGRPVRFKPADHPDKDGAKKACRAWEKHWPEMHAEPAMLDLLETSAGIGFAYSQIIWDTAGDEWKPFLKTFSARYSWYHWILRQHIAVTLDGMYPITAGDGHWVMHAPYGEYRGWMRSAMWPLAQWWLARNYALRDWARYCERHGFPLLLADTPFGADPNDISNYQSQLAAIGAESVLQLPGSVDVNQFGKYDLRYLEAKDKNWSAFQSLIEQCNTEITLALLGQNLTSQVKEGSFAAARVHADVRQAILEADARALAKTLQNQVLRPWAALNYGDPMLAPVVSWDVRADEDLLQKSQTFASFANGIKSLRDAGFMLDDPTKFAKRFGLVGLVLTDVPPTQVETKLAAGGQATDDKGDLKQVGGDQTEEGDDDSKEDEEPKKAKKPDSAKKDAAADKMSKAAGKMKKAVDKMAATIERGVIPAEPTPQPTPKLTFAQRHAAFLADVREMKEGGFEVDLKQLAKLHNVPVPKLKAV